MNIIEAISTGKKIYRQVWRDHEPTLPISSLCLVPSNGVYTLKLSAEDCYAKDWQVVKEEPKYSRKECVILLQQLRSTLFVTESLIDSVLHHLSNEGIV
jgi:hypothetical protein